MKLFKWLSVPNGETLEIKAYESWTVRWKSVHREYDESLYASIKTEAEVFTTKEDAENFAFALKAAFKLTKSKWADPIIEQN